MSRDSPYEIKQSELDADYPPARKKQEINYAQPSTYKKNKNRKDDEKMYKNQSQGYQKKQQPKSQHQQYIQKEQVAYYEKKNEGFQYKQQKVSKPKQVEDKIQYIQKEPQNYYNKTGGFQTIQPITEKLSKEENQFSYFQKEQETQEKQTGGFQKIQPIISQGNTGDEQLNFKKEPETYQSNLQYGYGYKENERENMQSKQGKFQTITYQPNINENSQYEQIQNVEIPPNQLIQYQGNQQQYPPKRDQDYDQTNPYSNSSIFNEIMGSQVNQRQNPSQYDLKIPQQEMNQGGRQFVLEDGSDDDDQETELIQGPSKRNKEEKLEVSLYLQENRDKKVLQQKEQMLRKKRQDNQDPDQINHSKYVNRREWEDRLCGRDAAQQLSLYFNRYYPKRGELKKAIENIQEERFKNLLTFILKSLEIFIEEQNNDYLPYVREICQCDTLHQLLKKQLNYYLQQLIAEETIKLKIQRFIKQILQTQQDLLKISSENFGFPLDMIKQYLRTYDRVKRGQFTSLLTQIAQIQEILQQQHINQKKQEQEQEARIQELSVIKVIQNIPIDYIDCPSEPAVLDFIQRENNKDSNQPVFGTIFPVYQDKPYPNVDIFLNNHFYILREDYLREFRMAINSLRNSTIGRIDRQVSLTVYLYSHIELENLYVMNKGIQFAISAEPYEARNRNIDWMKTKRLMTGTLLALTTDKFDRFVFATVLERPDPRSHRDSKRIRFTISVVAHTFKEQIESLNELLMSNDSLLILENKVFFETYVHYLNCLKDKDPITFPFQDQIIYAKESNNLLPKYLQNIPNPIYDINLKFDLQKESNRAMKPIQVNILSKDWPRQIQESLDDSQLRSIQLMLSKGIALVQGPPGTGKTYCGALAVRILLQNQTRWNRQTPLFGRMTMQITNKPILIVCYTNHALDQFLHHILTFTSLSDIVRIGGRCKDEKLQQVLLQNLNKQKDKDNRNNRIDFNWQEFFALKDQLSDKLKQLVNQKDNIHYKNCLQFWPEFVEKIVAEFLLALDLIFERSLSEPSRKYIVHMWLDTKKMREDDAIEVIAFEKGYGNKLIRQYEQQNIQKLRTVMRQTVVYQVPEFRLNEQMQVGLNAIIDDGIDENNQIDSDDEEDRKLLLNVENLDERVKQREFQNARRFMKRMGYDHQQLENILSKIHQGYRVWELSQLERMLIQQRIFKLKYEDLSRKYGDQIKKFEELARNLQEAYIERDLQIIQSKKIIGVTVSGCAKYAKKLANLDFSIMIIEEAAEVLESHTAAILGKNVEHLILIGDHFQLKPKLESYYLETKYQTNISLFERLVKNNVSYVTLETQRRMKSSFADFIRLIYGDTYKDHELVQAKNAIQIQGMKNDILFFNHREKEQNEQFSASKSNPFEADMIVGLVNYLIKNKHEPHSITVLTTYVKQALYLNQVISKVSFKVKVQTVDNYQGEENDIIILSLVRSNTQGKLGFVGIDNRICVALSRARIGLYVFGNFDFISSVIRQEITRNRSKKYTDLWLQIIELAQIKQIYSNSITLKCASHSLETEIRNVRDWQKVPGGGCTNDCNIKFPCGHVCKQKCHLMEHTKQNCMNQCELILDCGHKCSGLCKRQPCPPCLVKVQRKIGCGHEETMKCSDDPKRIHCTQPCQKQLPCGHQCKLTCGADCSKQKCYEKVFKILDTCGHTINVPCVDSQLNQKLICTEPCKITLPCGDKCGGTCGSCMQNLHRPCEAQCKKLLLCGHECNRKCGQPCGRCNKKCEYQCCVYTCSNKCGDICVDCLNDCNCKCIHSKCDKKCSEVCSRIPCNEPCLKILDCGCQCLGLCGEKCPKLCRIPEHGTDQDVFKYFFENEDEQESRFYELECVGKHCFEVEGLDKHFEMEANKSEIGYLKCPKCKNVVRQSNRYRNLSKMIQQNMNKIKRKKNEGLIVTEDMCDDLIELIKINMAYLKTESMRDENNFLHNMERTIKTQIKNIENGQSCEFVYHEYACLSNQMTFYIDGLKLRQTSLSHSEFEIQKYVIMRDYIMSEDFYKWSTTSFWQKLESKIHSLRLYQEVIKEYQSSKKVELAQLSYEIEDAQFLLDQNSLNKIRVRLEQLGGQLLALHQVKQIDIAVKDLEGQGNWFKCPNGHVFVIGNGVGAMEGQQCPECEDQIQQQQLDQVLGNPLIGQIVVPQITTQPSQANLQQQ